MRIGVNNDANKQNAGGFLDNRCKMMIILYLMVIVRSDCLEKYTFCNNNY